MARARIIDAENEAPPDADRLAGWPHPRETQAVFGHGAAEAVALESVSAGRLHHGWLIMGEEGIGKAAFAYRLVRFLLAQGETLPASARTLDAPDQRIVRQIASLSHPSLFVVRRAWDATGKKFRQTVAVDEIRALRHFLQRTSVTPWRAVVVDSADDLNANSANALLKSLEEPPARTLFLILSSAPGRLPPTIRSRCRLLRLEPLAADDLARAVGQACAAAERAAPDAEQMRALGQLARGSARRVLQLMDSGALGIAEMLTRLLVSLPALDRVELHKLVALTGARETEPYTMAFDILEEMLAETLRGAAMGAGATRFPQLRPLAALMEQGGLADWAGLWETIREARGEAERLNLDKAALVLTVFDKLDGAAKAAARRAGRASR